MDCKGKAGQENQTPASADELAEISLCASVQAHLHTFSCTVPPKAPLCIIAGQFQGFLTWGAEEKFLFICKCLEALLGKPGEQESPTNSAEPAGAYARKSMLEARSV